jgi:DNA-binding PadR family transcriptional regulator
MRRGDVRPAILRLLSEQPMHGYQIIQELSARSEGAWSPSAGSVYPTLQLLADEGLIIAEETGGKKVFSLTEDGRAEVAKTADQPARGRGRRERRRRPGYREAAGKLMQVMWQIGTSATADQTKAAIESSPTLASSSTPSSPRTRRQLRPPSVSPARWGARRLGRFARRGQV